uniref:Uncharacterized protein n=1 Tax=Arundo donax TaxID=35708 RepID=A0A0A9FFG0_ARUDO
MRQKTYHSADKRIIRMQQ